MNLRKMHGMVVDENIHCIAGMRAAELRGVGLTPELWNAEASAEKSKVFALGRAVIGEVADLCSLSLGPDAAQRAGCRVGKGAVAPCPPSLRRLRDRMVGTPPDAFAPGGFAHPTHLPSRFSYCICR